MTPTEALEDALKRARADAAMFAMDLHAKSRNQDALEGVARALERRNAELEATNQRLMDAISNELTSIKARADEAEAVKARWEGENALLREQVSIMEEKVKVHEEHAGRSQKAMETCEALFDAKARHADELRRGLEEELTASREEIKKRMERELELMQDLRTYGEKFEQFKDVVKKNDEALDGYANEVHRAKKQALEAEKAKLEMSLQMKKGNVQLIELVDERESLKARVKQLENQNNALDKLSRTLTERLRLKENAI